MPAPSTATFIRPNPRAVYRKLNDDAGGVVLHLDTAAYHGVNEFGTYVWELLADGVTFEALMAQIAADVTGAPPSVRDEVGAFIADLHERGLVSYGEAGDG